MLVNEFGQSGAMDFAPEGSVCECCDKPAPTFISIHYERFSLHCRKYDADMLQNASYF